MGVGVKKIVLLKSMVDIWISELWQTVPESRDKEWGICRLLDFLFSLPSIFLWKIDGLLVPNILVMAHLPLLLAGIKSWYNLENIYFFLGIVKIYLFVCVVPQNVGSTFWSWWSKCGPGRSHAGSLWWMFIVGFGWLVI